MAKKESSLGSEIGLAAAALAGIAGAYFLYGSKDAPKNRKKVSGWVVKAKGEVLERLEKLKEIGEQDYHSVVDTVVSKYQALKKGEPEQIAELVKELKGYWSKIQKEAKSQSKGAVKGAKKVAKAVVKNVSKEVTKVVKKATK